MLYRSTDGGATWDPIPFPGDSIGSDYFFGQQSVAISCGAPSFCVLEYTTTDPSANYYVDAFAVSSDGGLTWQPVGGGGLDPAIEPTRLTCAGMGTCLEIVKGSIQSTTDGGMNWKHHDESVRISDLACLSVRLCYVVQNTSKRGVGSLIVSSTSNRGGTLTPKLRMTGTGWTGTPFISCASALACTVLTPGPDPVQESTSNGGRTWHTKYGPPLWPDQRVEALQCTTARLCTLLATDHSAPSRIVSLSTTDGGWSWLPAVTVGHLGSPGARAILTCSATTCNATLGGHLVYSIDDVRLTSSTWTSSGAGDGSPLLSAVACQQDGACLAVGSGVKATSTDDGHTWTVAADPALDGDVITSLTCPLPTTCVASGYSGTAGAPNGLMLLTTDLGSDWTAANLPWEVGYVSDVECASASTCLALPGFASSLHNVPTYVIRSTDGGLNWSLLEIAAASAGVSLSAVQCPTATHCIAVGAASSSAHVVVSDDAGATWTMVDPTSGGFAGEMPFDGLACTSSLACETSVVPLAPAPEGSYAVEVDAYATTDGGATWSKLAQMLSIPPAGYSGASPMLASCSNGSCVASSSNVIGPERPSYYVTILASADGGATWIAYDSPFESTGAIGPNIGRKGAGGDAGVSVAIAPDGTVIAAGENDDAGPLLLVSTA